MVLGEVSLFSRFSVLVKYPASLSADSGGGLEVMIFTDDFAYPSSESDAVSYSALSESTNLRGDRGPTSTDRSS
jgi:hypothetical protein